MAAKQEIITEILRKALFGEKKKTGKRTAPTQEKSGGSTTDDSQIALLRSIAANARISAKNSMALPAILQQTNIMQKNVAKMVRLQGEKPSSKADVFFSNAKFREGAYEASYRKNMGPENISPTQDKPVEKKSIAGLFGSMFGIFKSVFNVDFLKKVLIGGAIIGGLTKYFGDAKFREQVNTMLTELRRALITDEAWEKLKSGLFNLGLGALALYAAFKYVTFKLNTMAIASALGGCGCGTPVGPVGTGGRGGKPGGKYKKGDLLDKNGRPLAGTALEARKKKLDRLATPQSSRPGFGSRFGSALNAAALVGFGYNMISSGSEELGSMSDSGQPGASPEATRGPNYTSIGINTLFAASTAGSLVYNAKRVKDFLSGGKVEQKLAQTGRAQSIIGKMKDLFTKARAKSWGPRFMSKLTTKLGASAVGRRILPKVATAVAGFFFPGPGWLATIFSVIWIAVDLYFLYTIFESIFDELSREDSGGSTSPVNTDESSKNSTSPAQRSSGTGAGMPTAYLPGSGSSAGMALAQFFTGTGAPAGSGGNAPPGAFKNVDFSQVKDKIIAGEGTAKYGNPYEEVFGYGAYGKPSKKLTDMTLAEVQAFQSKLIANTTNKGIRGLGENEGTGAVGAYQFTKETLAARAEAVYGKNRWQKIKFTPEVQDILAKNLFDAVKSNNAALSPTWAYFSDLNAAGAQLRAQGATGGSLNFKPAAGSKKPEAGTDEKPIPVDAQTGEPVKVGQVQRPAGAFNRATGDMFGNIYNDNSTQVVNAPTSGGGSPAAAPMASVYDSQLQHLLLNQAIG